MERCPVKLVVKRSANTDHVLVLNFAAVVYRKPDGRYYIIHGNMRLFVELNEQWSGFVLTINRQLFNWLLYPQPVKESKSYVEKEKLQEAAFCQQPEG